MMAEAPRNTSISAWAPQTMWRRRLRLALRRWAEARIWTRLSGGCASGLVVGIFWCCGLLGNDDYNPYIAGLEDGALCKLNSVVTLILPNREAAMDPFVAETIAHAEAIFIAGGDQANYIRFWMGTPVQAEINKAIQRGVPVGGTSAGLAVMGEWAYSAEGDKPDDPNLDGKTALMDPMGPRVTLVHGFLEIPILKGIITDSHFAKRDRMGRLLVFLARIQSSKENPNIRGIGIDERAAVLMEPDGEARVVGFGNAYLVMPFPPAPVILSGKSLDAANFDVHRIRPGSSFDLSKRCCGDTPYSLVVEKGDMRTTRDIGPIY